MKHFFSDTVFAVLNALLKRVSYPTEILLQEGNCHVYIAHFPLQLQLPLGRVASASDCYTLDSWFEPEAKVKEKEDDRYIK